MYIYVYIYRERERGNKKNWTLRQLLSHLQVVYIYVCVYVYVVRMVNSRTLILHNLTKSDSPKRKSPVVPYSTGLVSDSIPGNIKAL